ncbi:hypothetical protein BDF20DRAFT_898966 [Mycotypha africana]|uniref:uncharacterized protein n=1 Tax=Mycotypha africana TaxID=64632 RepID=UPI0022FFD0FE|nr:uncharacterized protein BDF20DRAFT_898966 [Mycotypha africana]KAI8967741.1 hypothetical protein BDF20DRAFT_898966 [Mycotypha africana]
MSFNYFPSSATTRKTNKTLTLDDFLQLQSLLNYEQEARDRHIQACYSPAEENARETILYPFVPHSHPLRLRHVSPQAAHQSRLEKQRLEQATLNLKYLKDQYRRQRAAEIQAYVEAYRRQALIRAVQQEEEERYQRQCIAAALEQRRVNELWKRYMAVKSEEAAIREQLKQQMLLRQQQQQQQQQLAVLEKEKDDIDMEEATSDEEEGYSRYHSAQLADLLRHVFGQQVQQQRERLEEGNDVTYFADEHVQDNEPAPMSDDDAMAMDEVWKYLSDQKKRDSEAAPSSNVGLSASRSLDDDAETVSSSPSTATNMESLDDANTEASEMTAEEQQRQEELKALPPLQEHVVTLKDLISQLASEPVLVGEQYNAPSAAATTEKPMMQQFSDEPKPSGIWVQEDENLRKKQQQEEEEQQQKKPMTANDAATTSTAQDGPSSTEDKNKEAEKEEEEGVFLPKQVITEAEPTPQLEQMPNTPVGTEEERPSEQQKKVVDSRKMKVMEDLDKIEAELTSEDSDLHKRWKHVLDTKNLSFTKQSEGTLLLTASTDANRQFLGSEDELMRVMLKLDAIESNGDEEIRLRRRGLVKQCEHMLDCLDQLKQAQWEPEVTHQQRKKRHRRRHKKNKKSKH